MPGWSVENLGKGAHYDWVHAQARRQQVDIKDISFTRRQGREALGWSTTPIRIHLDRLCHHEYVVPNGGGRGRLATYSLLYDGRGREGQPSLVGLIDPAQLKEPQSTAT